MRALELTRLRLTLTGLALALLLGGGEAALAATVELVSRVDPGSLASTGSGAGPNFLAPPSISADGRYVAFLSVENNLVTGQVDLNANGGQQSDDVFLYDRVARTVALVSHAEGSPTTSGNGESRPPVISADGRWVAFTSQATNLVSGLEEAPAQVRLFLYDRISEAVTLVSSSPAIEATGCSGCGVISVAISANGRFVAFNSTAPDLVPGQPAENPLNVFLYDRVTGRTTLVSTGGPSGSALDFSLSADGRFLAFDLLPPPNQELGTGGVYLYDRVAGASTRVGSGSNPTLSADGGSVAFLSSAAQVIPGQVDANGTGPSGVDVFLYSRLTRATVLVSHAVDRPATTGNAASDPRLGGQIQIFPLLSADGRYVAFLSSATNLVRRQVARPGSAIFLYDRASGAVTLASRSAGSPVKPSLFPTAASLSADGRYLTFVSGMLDLVPGQTDVNSTLDVFLFDRSSGTTTLVSSRGGSARATGNGASDAPAISADGTQIAFYSVASNLVPVVIDLNHTEDLFLYDVRARANAVASLHAPGAASRTADADSSLRALSGDGRWVLFEGGAANLAPGQVDLNGQSDVFLYDHLAKTVTLVSHASGSPATAGDGFSAESAMSADGRFVAFTSYATNLDPTVRDYVDPRTGQRRSDVFLFDRATGRITALSRSALPPGLTGDFDSGKPAVSADGRWIAFRSEATDLVPATGGAAGTVYLYDRVAGILSRTSAGATSRGLARPLTLSADGRYLAVLTPDPIGHDVYLYDRVARAQVLVSHAPDGTPAGVLQDDTPALSADGRFVAFTSTRSDLAGEPGGAVNVYLWDRENGAVTLAGASQRVGIPFPLRHPALSADGRWLVFLSNAETPAPGFDNPGHANQVVLFDRVTGARTLLTPSALVPGQADQMGAALPAITPDARWIAFQVFGAGLYLYDRLAGTASLVAATQGSALLLSDDGREIALESPLSNLVPRDFNGVRRDVFLFSGARP